MYFHIGAFIYFHIGAWFFFGDLLLRSCCLPPVYYLFFLFIFFSFFVLAASLYTSRFSGSGQLAYVCGACHSPEHNSMALHHCCRQRTCLCRSFVTTELVSLGSRIGTDTGCVQCEEHTHWQFFSSGYNQKQVHLVHIDSKTGTPCPRWLKNRYTLSMSTQKQVQPRTNQVKK